MQYLNAYKILQRVIKSETVENNESSCVDREENVLAHMPSVKVDARITAVKDDAGTEDRSDDDASKLSVSEDTLSR